MKVRPKTQDMLQFYTRFCGRKHNPRVFNFRSREAMKVILSLIKRRLGKTTTASLWQPSALQSTHLLNDSGSAGTCAFFIWLENSLGSPLRGKRRTLKKSGRDGETQLDILPSDKRTEQVKPYHPIRLSRKCYVDMLDKSDYMSL